LTHSATGSVYNLIVPGLNAAPYLACLAFAITTTRPAMPLCAALIVLLIDVYLFHGYFLSTRTYRFAMIEVYQVIFKMVVILPIGCFIGFVIDKLGKHDAQKQAE
jgi:hypothetical protein